MIGSSQFYADSRQGTTNVSLWPRRAKANFKLAAVNQSSKAGQQGKF